MTKFPAWKYFIIICAVIIGFVYTLPNFYGEVPAVQISGSRSSVVVDSDTINKLTTSLNQAKLSPIGEVFDGKTLKFKFASADIQLKARDVIQQTLGDSYIVALNLISASPDWMSSINASPMFLGLDLRGGVHFLLEIDMDAAVKKMLNKYVGEIRRDLRTNQIRYGAVEIRNGNIAIELRDASSASQVISQLRKDLAGLQFNQQDNQIIANISDNELKTIKEDAVKQNIVILHNRVNELGVA
ncbi:MAG: protein translocase subunit SecD, partial [Pseudomonadota bacterium]